MLKIPSILKLIKLQRKNTQKGPTVPSFSIAELLPSGKREVDHRLGPNIPIKVPKWAFKPDDWNRALLDGFDRLVYDWNWDGLGVWEVGVGTGVNLVVLRHMLRVNSIKWYFSDYDARCVPLAMENLLCYCGDRRGLYPLKGSWDLVTPPKGGLKAPKVDVVFGCLPQVPLHTDLSVGDKRAHYYNPKRYPKAHQNALGLGLVETLLVRARDVLNPGGKVILNLAGRPGRKRLLSLFRETGYNPHMVESAKIEQHAGTSLASLAALEKNGHDDFEFFTDFSCEEPIDARGAEALRVAGEDVYHKIYVIAGTLA